MKLNHLIIIGALCGALLLPSSASSWGVVGLSAGAGGGGAGTLLLGANTSYTGGTRSTDIADRAYLVYSGNAVASGKITKGYLLLANCNGSRTVKMVVFLTADGSVVEASSGIAPSNDSCSAGVVEFTFAGTADISSGTSYGIYVIWGSSGGGIQHDADGTTDWSYDSTDQDYDSPATYIAVGPSNNIGKHTAYVTN